MSVGERDGAGGEPPFVNPFTGAVVDVEVEVDADALGEDASVEIAAGALGGEISDGRKENVNPLSPLSVLLSSSLLSSLGSSTFFSLFTGVGAGELGLDQTGGGGT